MKDHDGLPLPQMENPSIKDHHRLALPSGQNTRLADHDGRPVPLLQAILQIYEMKDSQPQPTVPVSES